MNAIVCVALLHATVCYGPVPEPDVPRVASLLSSRLDAPPRPTVVLWEGVREYGLFLRSKDGDPRAMPLWVVGTGAESE